MTLNRDAARALFDNAEPTPAGNGAPFAAASPFASVAPFGDGASEPYAAATSRPARKGADWRLIAPIGVAAVCAVAVLVIAQTRDTAEPGRTVAASEIVPPTPMPQAAPLTPAPVETAALAPPASSIVTPPATRPAPVAAARVRTEPARRAPAPRTVAAAPSAADASSDASTRVPYVPPPALGAPAVVTIAPPAPAPAPVPTPEPQPVTPPQ